MCIGTDIPTLSLQDNDLNCEPVLWVNDFIMRIIITFDAVSPLELVIPFYYLIKILESYEKVGNETPVVITIKAQETNRALCVFGLLTKICQTKYIFSFALKYEKRI